MNNTDFRRIVLDTPGGQAAAQSPPNNHKSEASNSSLGSRSRASIPMTPRSVKGGAPTAEFARQLAELNGSSQASTKQFRASAAPKGVKLGKGYVDRARERMVDETEKSNSDTRAARIQALEEQLKLDQIDQATFETLRDQITGGDLSATHLVKGLDRKLLDRIRKGEDVVSSSSSSQPQPDPEKSPEADADEELDQLEAQDLAPVQHEKSQKRGEMAPPPPPAAAPTPVAGTKRSRDQILAELKASRKAAQEAQAAAQPQLGSKFRKFGDPAPAQPRIERDDKGREVLITVDQHGQVKRKVRKVAHSDLPKKDLPMPDKAAKPLGMAVPEAKLGPAASDSEDDDDDDDIFQGVGDTFDPLDALEQAKQNQPDNHDSSSSSDSSDSEQQDKSKPVPQKQDTAQTSEGGKHNYFNDTTATDKDSTATATAPTLQDPTILAALHRAAQLGPRSTDDIADARASNGNPASDAATRLQARMRDRDMDDLDMGFGSSRFEDEDDEGGPSSKMKLSEWKGVGAEDDDDEEDKGRGGTKQRKRGKKKKKGDKNSASDVLGILAGRNH